MSVRDCIASAVAVTADRGLGGTVYFPTAVRVVTVRPAVPAGACPAPSGHGPDGNYPNGSRKIYRAARYVHAIGMLMGSLDKLRPVRFTGALFTYLAGFALCVAAVTTI